MKLTITDSFVEYCVCYVCASIGFDENQCLDSVCVCVSREHRISRSKIANDIIHHMYQTSSVQDMFVFWVCFYFLLCDCFFSACSFDRLDVFQSTNRYKWFYVYVIIIIVSIEQNLVCFCNVSFPFSIIVVR